MNRGIHTSEFWLAFLCVVFITVLSNLERTTSAASFSIGGIAIIYTLARVAIKTRGGG